MFDQPIIRVCLVLGSLITATYILRRVRLAKVQMKIPFSGFCSAAFC